MERREFLRKGLALGAAGLLPGVGLTANDCLSLVSGIPSEPIWDAAVNGRWDVVKQWLRHDPALIATTGNVVFGINCNYEKSTLLHVAVGLKSDVSVLKYLVFRDIDVNAKDSLGYTPLHHAAEFSSNVDVLEYLVSQGSAVNVKCNNGCTPLHTAVWGNPNMAVLEWLVLKGADVNEKNNSLGFTPLNVASLSGNIAKVEYLKSVGALD